MYLANGAAEIAANRGYVDSAHFCRRFKETTGVTIKQYRVTQPAG